MIEVPNPDKPFHVEEGVAGISKANIMLDMSKFDLFQLCEMRYFYRHILKRSPPLSQKASALDTGGVVHEGMEVYFKLLAEGVHYNDRMQAALMKVRQVGTDPELSNLDPDELRIVIDAVEQSCDFWRHEDEHLEILAVEQPFAYVLYEDDFVRIISSGKIDLLVNKRQLGGSAAYSNLPIDHKTFKRDFPVHRLTNQFQNYAKACDSNFLVVNRIGLQKTLKPEEKFKRLPLSYDPLILEQWKNNVVRVVLGRYLACIAEGDWTMNLTSCDKFNRKCEYFELCDTSGEEAKAFKLEQNFVEAPEWDVTKGLKND